MKKAKWSGKIWEIFAVLVWGKRRAAIFKQRLKLADRQQRLVQLWQSGHNGRPGGMFIRPGRYEIRVKSYRRALPPTMPPAARIAIVAVPAMRAIIPAIVKAIVAIAVNKYRPAIVAVIRRNGGRTW